ncbi:MAG TPA: hypothetical protein VFS43_15220 [Polyangiaceae bacterium]|nr:hypothetical protein [Polyangiaceae bacterium]
MRRRTRALLLPWPLVLAASVACNVLTGADDLKVGGGVVEGAAGEGTGGEGEGEPCRSEPDCRACCARRVNVSFFAFARRYFNECLCDPARGDSSGSGDGTCDEAIEGCEDCCGSLCGDLGVMPTAEHVVRCAQCASRQGEGQGLCADPRSLCEEVEGDSVCATYYNCEEAECAGR